MSKQTNNLLFILGIIIAEGCFSPARLKDFPQNAQAYDFNKIANSKKDLVDQKWNSRKHFEYYLKLNTTDDTVLTKAVTNSLLARGFEIKFIDKNKGTVIGKRGLKANEWNCITGIYYQKTTNGYEVYINCKITQDITGGWAEDRAKEIGDAICKLLTCSESYSVLSTTQK